MRASLILTFFCLILVLFCVYSASGLVAINSRGELVACNGSDCVSFDFGEMDANFTPNDYFHAETMNTGSLYYYGGFDQYYSGYSRPHYLSKFKLAVVGGDVFALDLDGNIWRCNFSEKQCRELDLGLSGYITSSSILEKNIIYIISGNNNLYIAGKDENYGAIWKYNPVNDTVSQIYKDSKKGNIDRFYNSTSYSYPLPLFKNNNALGFAIYAAKYYDSELSEAFRPIRIGFDGTISDTNYVDVVSINGSFDAIYPGSSGGIITAGENIGSGPYYGKFFINSQSLISTEVSSYGSRFTTTGTGLQRLPDCKYESPPGDGCVGNCIDIEKNGFERQIPLNIIGNTIACYTGSGYDERYSNYFENTPNSLWFTFNDGVHGEKLGACDASYEAASVTCKFSEIDFNMSDISLRVISIGDSIFMQSDEGKVYHCNHFGNANYLTCLEYPINEIKTNSNWLGESITLPAGNNSLRVYYGRFASILDTSFPTDSEKAFYAIDAVGALWSCSRQDCELLNPGITFSSIRRIAEFGEYTDIIVAWDSGGKLWNCSLDGTGCTLASKDMISVYNIKVVSDFSEGSSSLSLPNSGCSSYNISNSHCNNNCLPGFEKINIRGYYDQDSSNLAACVPIKVGDVLGTYFYTDSNIYRCDYDNCLQLPTSSAKINSMKQSLKRGVIAIADNNRILECIDNNCSVLYSSIVHKPTLIVPAKSGVFFIGSQSEVTRKIYFIEYGGTSPNLLMTYPIGGPTLTGFSFEDTAYLAGYFCTPYGCITNDNYGGEYEQPSNIGGSYTLNTSSISYNWAKGSFDSFGVTGLEYTKLRPYLTGSAIVGSSMDTKSHVIISPYGSYRFNSLDSISMPPVFSPFQYAYGGAYIPEEDAFLIKSNSVSVGSNIFQKISYCTQYGCKPINCDKNLYARALQYPIIAYRQGIIPSYEYYSDLDKTILGYTIDNLGLDNHDGSVLAIVRDEVTREYSCENITPTEMNYTYLFPSSNGFFGVKAGPKIFHCTYLGCNEINSGNAFFYDVYLNYSEIVSDNSGGFFAFKQASSKYTPYYCSTSECHSLMSTALSDIKLVVPAYQSVISSCGDGYCSGNESIYSCPSDCNGLTIPSCCGENAKNYLFSDVAWPGISYNYFCTSIENATRTDLSLIPFPQPNLTLSWRCLCDSYGVPECIASRDASSGCGSDGFCNSSCAPGIDPDCGECDEDSVCNPTCEVDPDCETQCGDGIISDLEECGEVGLVCDGDEVCVNCLCVPSTCLPFWFDCDDDGICESNEKCANNKSSVIGFELIVKNGSVYSNAQCTLNEMADLNIYFNDLLYFTKTIPCTENETENLIGSTDLFKEGVNKGIFWIGAPCNVCDKTDYFAITLDKSAKIPDNNVFGIFIILLSVIFIFTLKNKSVN